jgi:ATP-dependent DNA helicase RecQ
MESSTASLLPALKQYFGFTSFRPLQEQIIRDALSGRDVFALLPTGGGKSLCFQLPALVQPGLTVVVSPLISLMKDQVDALQASGVAATFLNSTLGAVEARSRLRGLHTGQFRLLYAAPERLMLSGTLEDLKKWNVNLIAIDEAHCISEWGHDFRPEYRQLAELRDHFPGVPMMALTATATERVRGDIVAHLGLRDAGCYVASFNRPNLIYRVLPKSQPYDQLFGFVNTRRNESGIVYCQSRKGAESVAERLNADGIKAAPYHAGLEGDARARNQELFLRDEVRVVCATIAFGMGINKPNVRYVVHYDLPKNIEGYYQETGRAGRDGLPSECLLLFSPGDVMKQMKFIDEKPSVQEQKIAREQLQQMVHYAEASDCRRVTLLRYFGEEWTPDSVAAVYDRRGHSAEPAVLPQAPDGHRPPLQFSCGGCDNCLAPRETFDGTLAAQKFLSCVFRVRQKSALSFGLNHIVEVLTGADTEMVRKWRHHEVSTYGIGKEMKRAEWQAIGRELIRLGYVRQTTDKFGVVELTPEGRALLSERRAVTLTRPAQKPEPVRHVRGEIECDEALFERLRVLRRRLADERDVPAYIIFSDVALREMARNYPANEAEFGRISGVGRQKQAEFAAPFLAEIADYLRTNPKQVFVESFTVPAAAPKPRVNDSIRETLSLFRAGKPVEQIARERGFVASTIYGHLASAIEAGEQLDAQNLLTAEQERLIEAAFAKVPAGTGVLSAVKESLGDKADYGQIRIYLALKRTAQAL